MSGDSNLGAERAFSPAVPGDGDSGTRLGGVAIDAIESRRTGGTAALAAARGLGLFAISGLAIVGGADLLNDVRADGFGGQEPTGVEVRIGAVGLYNFDVDTSAEDKTWAGENGDSHMSDSVEVDPGEVMRLNYFGSDEEGTVQATVWQDGHILLVEDMPTLYFEDMGTFVVEVKSNGSVTMKHVRDRRQPA